MSEQRRVPLGKRALGRQSGHILPAGGRGLVAAYRHALRHYAHSLYLIGRRFSSG